MSIVCIGLLIACDSQQSQRIRTPRKLMQKKIEAAKTAKKTETVKTDYRYDEEGKLKSSGSSTYQFDLPVGVRIDGETPNAYMITVDAPLDKVKKFYRSRMKEYVTLDAGDGLRVLRADDPNIAKGVYNRPALASMTLTPYKGVTRMRINKPSGIKNWMKYAQKTDTETSAKGVSKVDKSVGTTNTPNTMPPGTSHKGVDGILSSNPTPKQTTSGHTQKVKGTRPIPVGNYPLMPVNLKQLHPDLRQRVEAWLKAHPGTTYQD